MKRRILIPIDPEVEKCKFGSIYCKKEAVTKNDYDVPMCQPCFNIWEKLTSEFDTDVTNWSGVLVPKSCLEPRPSEDFLNWENGKPTLKLGKTKTERPENDDFFCGSQSSRAQKSWTSVTFIIEAYPSQAMSEGSAVFQSRVKHMEQIAELEARIQHLEQIVVAAYNWVGVKPTSLNVEYRQLMKTIAAERSEIINR